MYEIFGFCENLAQNMPCLEGVRPQKSMRDRSRKSIPFPSYHILISQKKGAILFGRDVKLII